ncbi:hypothetical protein M441DRAFT_63179 [Trichoderma asperellum CBS 433.97]|uniref:BZIP domain-containing protein n=1 Tax=Trichoderma asperellum (strain ATCC 204424 / CBS 433.97 / NBRC 101777) TaxID=1042311 RepID=A0A2T3YQG2_TRIA4|nr:hypothetical protein M441DRAFT_63179 [Trichoderma asperellum CBS 433.97]PTB34813.1 hypothetical protein M441DRAFT_63179 [Trichoderma asperellum CBS 433.97]
MQGVGINSSAMLPDLSLNTLNQAGGDESNKYPLPTSFEPWDYTQLTEGGTAMDPSLLSSPTSSNLISEQDNQFLMFPMDESPIISNASFNNSNTHTKQPTQSIIGKKRSTVRNQKRKRGPQNSRHWTEKKEQTKQRNRVAASKCRQKKREMVDELKEQSSSLEAQNNNLHDEYERLRKEIGQVKSDLMHHTECNDDNINQWISNEAKTYVDKLVEDGERRRMGSLSSSDAIEDTESAQAGLPFGVPRTPSRDNHLGL